MGCQLFFFCSHTIFWYYLISFARFVRHVFTIWQTYDLSSAKQSYIIDSILLENISIPYCLGFCTTNRVTLCNFNLCIMQVVTRIDYNLITGTKLDIVNSVAYQISTYQTAEAQRAVDGDWSTNSCTGAELVHPWWAVDIVSPVIVYSVSVTNDGNINHGFKHVSIRINSYHIVRGSHPAWP